MEPTRRIEQAVGVCPGRGTHLVGGCVQRTREVTVHQLHLSVGDIVQDIYLGPVVHHGRRLFMDIWDRVLETLFRPAGGRILVVTWDSS